MIDLCPIVHNIIADGLKTTSPVVDDDDDTATTTTTTATTAWTVVEASAHAHTQAHAGEMAPTFEDLVRFINHVTDESKVSPLEKFYTFVLGLLK